MHFFRKICAAQSSKHDSSLYYAKISLVDMKKCFLFKTSFKNMGTYTEKNDKESIFVNRIDLF